MSEWVIPVEEETGVPLALKPPDDLPPPGVRNQDADWHHLIYPKSRPELKTTSGEALRQVRLQWLNFGDHRTYHHYFNDYIIDEWEFPKTISQRFGIVVLMAAGYVPQNSIEITPEGPKYTQLDDYERRELSERGLLRIGTGWSVAKFLRDYTLAQDVVGAGEFNEEIEKLLCSKDEVERNIAGNRLLSVAASLATEEVRTTYIDAYRKHLILPNAPKEPRRLIFNESVGIGTAKRRRKAITALTTMLAKQLDIEPAAA